MKRVVLTLIVMLGGCSNIPQTWSEDEIREIAAEEANSDSMFDSSGDDENIRILQRQIGELASAQSDLELELASAQSEIAGLRSDISNHELMYDHR